MDFIRVAPPGADLAVVRRPGADGRDGSGAALFLHGLGDSASSFGPALETRPLESFELLLPDLLGHGQSDRPLGFDYTPASHAAVLFQALNKWGVAPPLHLVGYSFGAAVAVELARFPLVGLASLTLVEPALELTQMDFARRVTRDSEAAFLASYPSLLAEYADARSSEADRRWAETAAFASAHAFYRCAKGLLQSAKRGELVAHLSALDLPKTFILSPETYESWSLARPLEKSGVRVLLVGAPNKMPFYESPSAFYSAVAQAMGRASLRP